MTRSRGSVCWFLVLIAILIEYVHAQSVVITSTFSTVEVGETVEITYTPADDTPTTLTLRKGNSNDLQTIETLTTSATGGTFEWTVSNDLEPGDDYALQIEQDDGSESNFFGFFSITGGSNGGAAASVTSSSPPPETTTSREAETSSSREPDPSTSSEDVLRTSSETQEASSTSTTSTAEPTQSSLSNSATLTTSTSEQSSTPIPETSIPFAPSTSVSPSDSSGGLSTGAKAGIGVGATIGGIALFAGAFFLGVMFRRKKTTGGSDQEAGESTGKPELDGKNVVVQERSELGGAGMMAEQRPELDGTGRMAEQQREIGGREISGLLSRRAEMEAQQQEAPRELPTWNVGETYPPPVELGGGEPAPHSHTYEDPHLTENPWAGRQFNTR
ncbi:hypothetical protein CC78DRAFT_544714 [Lojkania enalia]|uniref:Yeast cell wall synthesis Kre9/Knh1-like N-terminal domain-containing protein n=1 Tax=Lojkania enalia TaxID=147567 RepID=A0A9P4K708_9PLEO|nr:hypothetical protein CC78DRAFT_544714 [Didymosphaeria enalia]